MTEDYLQDSATDQEVVSKLFGLGEDLTTRARKLFDNDLAPLEQGLRGAAGMTFQQLQGEVAEQLGIINRRADDMAEKLQTGSASADHDDNDSANDLKSVWSEGADAASKLGSGQ